MRRPDFLQKEFKESRAEHIAANFDLNGLGRLVLNLREGIYWIIDGCHRHHGLLKNEFGDYDVECEVYENLTDTEMASVFLLHAGRRVMSAFETFHVRCESAAARECDIRRIVEANGAKISRNKEPACISSVASLGKAYDAAGGVVLGQIVRVINRAFTGDPTAFDGQLIQALGLVLNRYNGKTTEKGLNEKVLIAHLSEAPNGLQGLFRRAEAQRERTGNHKSQCLAAVIVEVYNKGERTNRLPSWWKESNAA
jgi:hypothetical protein